MTLRLLKTFPPTVSREDVASVMRATIGYPTAAMRFDLCSKKGAPPGDLDALLAKSLYPWQA